MGQRLWDANNRWHAGNVLLPSEPRILPWSPQSETRAYKSLGAIGLNADVPSEISFINKNRWNCYVFDILRREYLDMRKQLLNRFLGEKLNKYVKKYLSLVP